MKTNIEVVYVRTDLLSAAEYNPRTWDSEAKKHLTESINKFGVVDPLIVNGATNRKNIVIGGHFRLEVLKELGHAEVPVVYLNIPDINKEKELNIRLNKNQGEFDLDLLTSFDEGLLADIGFSSEELDDIFLDDIEEDEFDLKKALERLDIQKISVKPGDVYEIDGSRLMCGDSTIESDMKKLVGNEKADMVMTDPPYILDYLTKPNQGGFGANQNRKYLGTDSLPPNFTELWMSNVAGAAQKDFSIIVYENWKNIRTIWNEMEKHWRVRNMIVWHAANRSQGYAGKHKFFNKHDIAIVGTTPGKDVSSEQEDALIENEYETALFAISGSPHWEKYEKGNPYCPTDFISHNVATEKSSGQGVVFGTKPIELLIPYIKVLTKRNQLVLEPFGGSGSTLIASIKISRRCFTMEKSPVYSEVILTRWEKLTGKKRVKINA